MNIKKIIKEEINKPSEQEFNQAIQDVRPLIPNISHRMIGDMGLERNSETVIRLNQEILQKIKEGDDEILDELWGMANSLVVKNAINIITFYTK
jgi:hypothetical protein